MCRESMSLLKARYILIPQTFLIVISHRDDFIPHDAQLYDKRTMKYQHLTPLNAFTTWSVQVRDLTRVSLLTVPKNPYVAVIFIPFTIRSKKYSLSLKSFGSEKYAIDCEASHTPLSITRLAHNSDINWFMS